MPDCAIRRKRSDATVFAKNGFAVSLYRSIEKTKLVFVEGYAGVLAPDENRTRFLSYRF